MRASGPDTTNATVTSLPFTCQLPLAVDTNVVIIALSSVPVNIEAKLGVRQPLHGLHWLGGS